MREIEFKAKEIGTGDWVYGYLVRIHEDDYRIVTEDDLNYAYTGGYDYDGSMTKIDKNTICQYTGLTDKNGNKIWENDVVEAWSDGTMACGKVQQRIDGTWIMYPAWQNKTMWYFIPNEFGETTVEVIGNIFDNPELLEDE